MPKNSQWMLWPSYKAQEKKHCKEYKKLDLQMFEIFQSLYIFVKANLTDG